MPVEIVVPELGESVLEATVGQWLKQPGDQVEVGEPVVELETDKVNVEVSARSSGVLKRIDRKEQEDVKVGDVLGEIDETGQPTEAQPQPAPDKQALESPAGIEAATQEQPPQTAQVGTEVEAQASGGEITPVARRFAEENDIDLTQVRGSGPGGRVTKADLEAVIARRSGVGTPPAAPQTQPSGQAKQPAAPREPQPPAQVPPQAPGAPAVPGKPVTAQPGKPVVKPEAPPSQAFQTDGRGEERVKMSRRRRTIARRLVEAQQTAAMLTTFNEVDLTAVIEMRKRRGEDFMKRNDVKLGFMSFFVKAVIGGLRLFPLLNAEIQGEEFVIKHYYDIGIAIGAEEGLVVPVLRNAERMTFAAIEKAIEAFSDKARENTLSLEDLRGGTFTITNGGVFGSLMSTPILTPPQVGILGMHKIEKRPVVIDDQIVIRPMMYLALSYDHRIVDGREAVQFLVKVKGLIEDPEVLLLEG